MVVTGKENSIARDAKQMVAMNTRKQPSVRQYYVHYVDSPNLTG